VSERSIGIIGATSLVGDCLLSSSVLTITDTKYDFIAFTRRSNTTGFRKGANITWRKLEGETDRTTREVIADFICLAPIWVIPECFNLFESYDAKRIVALSSTSRFTKLASPDSSEKDVAHHLLEGENQFIRWAERKGIEWIILRPTLIYGYGRDKNITAIAGFIKRFGFFPLLGAAKGLRQPIHADDVAKACLQVLSKKSIVNKDYNISGAEVLTYREMVERIFTALGKKKRIVSIPSYIFRAIVSFLSTKIGCGNVDVCRAFRSYWFLAIGRILSVGRLKAY